MTASRVLVELVVVLGTAAAISAIFGALRLPVVIGYVLAGLVIGPHVPIPLVADPGLVHLLSELGVILLMFAVGLELRISTLSRVGLGAAFTALVEVGLVLVAGTGVALALGWSALPAVSAGACVAIASTMLVARTVDEHGWRGGFTDHLFAILVFEDVIAIVLLAVLGGAASGVGVDLSTTVLQLAGFLAATLVGGLLVIPRAFAALARRARPETLLVAALALCFGGAALADHVGYSVALGAFLAGILIAESGRGHAVLELVRPFRDVFAVIFFVSIGMSIAPGDLVGELPAIGLFTAVVLVVKPLGVATGTILAGRGVTTGVRAGLALAQIGELSFVVAGISGSAPLLAISAGVCCATTLVSPWLARHSERLAAAIAHRLPARIATFASFYAAWLARLSAGEPGLARRLRGPVLLLALDAAAVIALAIAAASGVAGAWSIVVGLAALPFLVGVVRRCVVVARQLAAAVIPAGEALGHAPRRALTLTLALAIAIALAVPFAAMTQPFLAAGPAVLIALVVIAGLAYRSIGDFDGHVRAGSQLVLELIARPADRERPDPLAGIDHILPGFGAVSTLTLAARSPAVGRTLAELDLRARSGATVLAIAGPARDLATPSPHEPLCEGDVLALSGSDEAIAAAIRILAETTA